MKIRQIEIGKRFRKDTGDLTSLCESIKAVGLLHPIVVDEGGKLIAGVRRIEAFKSLGKAEIPVTVVNIADALRGEYDENVERMDFVPSEKVAIWEAMERPKGGRGKTMSDSDRVYGNVRDKAAKLTGMSTDTLSKARQVVKSKDKGLIEQMDRTGNVNRAYKELKRKERSKAREIIVPKDVNVTIKHGDFRRLMPELEDDSIDLILTDPPYGREYLPIWGDLALLSYDVLKPSGFLISYCGQSYLPYVIRQLQEKLEYYWLGMLYHKGYTGQMFQVNMWNRGKPILFFQKKPVKKQSEWIEDVLISEAPNKDSHEWGQNVEPLKRLINCFSLPGDIVLDPFMGGGSVIEACVEMKRNVMAFDIKKECCDLVKAGLK